MRVNRGMECVNMTETVYEPRDMAWIEKGVLGIEWNDGHKAVYPVRYLRQQCPCAACVDEWSGARRLQPNDVPLLIILQDVQPVARELNAVGVVRKDRDQDDVLRMNSVPSTR